MTWTNDKTQETGRPSWYDPDPPKLSQETLDLFAAYGYTEHDELIKHVVGVRDQAFAIHPYHCIGGWRFLAFRMSKHPAYAEALERCKSGQRLIDVGCCLGQDARKLVHDGAPASNVFATELLPSFVTLGQALFTPLALALAPASELYDQASAPPLPPPPQPTFIPCNFLDPLRSSPLAPLERTVDMLHACSFFSVLPRAEQEAAVAQALRLVKPGGLIFGSQPGSRGDEEGERDGNRAGAMSRERTRHTGASWRAVWEEIGRREGRKLHVHMEEGEGIQEAMKGGERRGGWGLRFTVRV